MRPLPEDKLTSWHSGGQIIVKDGANGIQALEVAGASELHSYYVLALLNAARLKNADAVQYFGKKERDIRNAIWERRKWRLASNG